MANASAGNAYVPGGAGGGGVGIAAGGATQTSGTVVFSNSNGVTFGYNNGTITATVTPGAAAGIGAIQLPNTTYTSGTANFINSNGVSFGSTTGGGITASVAAQSSLSFSNLNGVTFGTAGSTLTASVAAQSSLSFSNANGVSFGTAGSTLTASYNSTSAVGQGTTFAGTNVSASMTLNTAGVNLALSAAAGGGGGAAISAAGNSVNAGTVVFSNSNGISFGMAGSTITATVNPGAAAGIAAIQVSNTTYTSGTAIFSNANGFSFGSSAGGAITGSYTVPTQTQFVLSASNGLAFGTNGSTVTGSYSQSAQAFSASGGSSTFSTLNFANSNGVTFSNSAGSVVASYNSTSAAGQGTTFAGTNISASMTLNTAGLNLALSGAAGGGGSPNISAGTTSGNLGSIVFSNSNGVSFGLNGSTITASASGAGASVTVLAQSQTTGQSSSGTLALSALNVAGYGIISVGWSASTLQISGPGTTNFANLSVSAGTTSGSLGSLVFSNSNGVSFGLNGSTITASAAGGGGGAAISAGTQSTNGGTVVFSNSNNISFGMSNSSVITASYSQSADTIGLYALGNTTQNSSTTLDARTLSFNALGAMTMGYSNGSIQVSAPATSSISGTGAVSISVNGSTISIGAPNYGTLSFYDNGMHRASPAASQFGVGSIALQPIQMQGNFSISALEQFVSGSFSTSSNSSYAATLTARAGLYTLNGSTLSLASSGSQTYAFTNTSNNSTGSLSGIRGLTIPLNASMTPGNYWLGLWSSSASANANWATISNVVAAGAAFSGGFGAASTVTAQPVLGYGLWSTTSTNLPSSIGLSHITGTGASNAAFVNLYNVSA